jgi:hypothetical protein
VHEQTVNLSDSDSRAGIIAKGVWSAADGKPVVRESREVWAYALPSGEWMAVIDLILAPESGEAVFDKAGFGPIGVRLAKSLSVYFGGGVIRNSANEAGESAIFRKPARWVDYSGYIAPGVLEGLTLFDHPMNPDHPSPFHVREDGWMGAMLSTERVITATTAKPLHLRYGVYVHAKFPDPALLEVTLEDGEDGIQIERYRYPAE